MSEAEAAAAAGRRAVVIGGSGHVGNAVARELLARGWRVTVASRQPERARNLDGLDVVAMPGDAEAPGRFEALTRGQELVVDAAAPYPMALRTSADESVGRAERRTHALIDAVAASGATLAYVSSFTTLRSKRDPLDGLEAALARRLHPYFAVKDLIEQRIVDAAGSGLRAVIVNPTLCLGPWDCKPRELCWMAQVVRGEFPVVVRHAVNVVDVRDVAAGLLAAVDAERFGDPIRLSGHDIELASLCKVACDLGGGRAPTLSVPSPLGLLGAAWSESMAAQGDSGATNFALPAMLLSQHHAMPPARAQRDLGVHPRPLSQTVAATIGWYRELGYC